jgi:bacteriorhodopsin
MKPRTAQEERRSGIRWLIAGAFVLAASFAGWWLVATTNKEGTHDAELLSLFALIPLVIGLYYLVLARLHHV